jgi:hypothetical protein
MKLWTVFMFFLGTAAAASAGSNTLRIQSGYPFVDVMVNGAGPFRMLIDTGADSCMLTPKAAESAGLHFNARVTMMTVTGNSTVPMSSENEVGIGGNTRAKVEFVVSALDGVRQLDAHADGVIGQSFLRQAPYLIDYRARQLWLDDEAVEHGEGLPLVVNSVANSMETVVPVAIGTERAVRRLVLDSGSSDLILECAVTCPKLTSVENFDVRTNQGAGQIRRGVLAAMEVGGTALNKRPAALREPVSSERDGLLPASWFAAVYVDSPHNLVRFRTR